MKEIESVREMDGWVSISQTQEKHVPEWEEERERGEVSKARSCLLCILVKFIRHCAKKEQKRQSVPDCCFCMMGSHYYTINHVSDRLIVAALTALRRRQRRPEIRAVSNTHQQFLSLFIFKRYIWCKWLNGDINKWVGRLYYMIDLFLMIQCLA